MYPETQADIPAITADDWWVQRKNADPILMSMADGGGSSSQNDELVVKKVGRHLLFQSIITIITIVTRQLQMF